MPIGGPGSGGMAALKEALEERGRDFDSITRALFNAPNDLEQLQGRIGQGFTELIFGLPQDEPVKVLKALDQYAELVQQVK